MKPILNRTLAAIGLIALMETGVARATEVEEAWIDRYDGAASFDDYVSGIAVDSHGDVYIAGFTFVEIQQNYYSPFFLTVKYDPSGKRLWARTWASSASAGEALAIDAQDNVIVAGSTHLGEDWATIKYDPQGVELWGRTYDANSYYLSEPDDLAIDADGNVFLTGDASATPDDPTYTHTIKYDPQGNVVWARQYAGPEGGSAGAALAIDDAGNVYVAGSTLVANRGADFSVVKLDAAGIVQWLRTFGADGRFTIDRAEDIAIDGAGNVVVTGTYGRNSSEDSNVATLKLDPDGNVLWEALYDGPAGRHDYGTSLAVDGDDNVTVIGGSETDFDDYDAITLRYDTGGNLRWAERYAGVDLANDYAYGLSLDDDGNAYVVGQVDPGNAGLNYFTAKYDPLGNLEWEQLYGGPLNDGCMGQHVAVGFDHAVYVTGRSLLPASRNDIVTIKYVQPSEGIPGDVNGDGLVGFDDLLLLLAAWGPCDGACPADVDGNGIVEFDDLLVLLANWS